MRFVVFGSEGRVGLLDGGRVLDLQAAQLGYARSNDASEPGLSTLTALIESGQRGLDLVRLLAEKSRGSDQPGLHHELSNLKLQAPWAGQRLLMAGVNYVDHVVDAFAHMGAPLSKADVYANTRKGSPQLFWAVARPVVGCDARIEIPSRANGLFDYEGEAAVVLGRRGKDLKLADCKSFVWGVTQVIDWSVREEGWPPKPPNPFLWTKNFDGSKSIGPCIAVDEIDIQDFQLQTWVSGELRQDHNTRDMIFSFAELLEFASKDLTLYPGDVLSGGTGAGTAVDRTIPNKNGSWPRDGYLKPGDTVDVRSTIGSLVGHVVAKSTTARGSA